MTNKEIRQLIKDTKRIEAKPLLSSEALKSWDNDWGFFEIINQNQKKNIKILIRIFARQFRTKGMKFNSLIFKDKDLALIKKSLLSRQGMISLYLGNLDNELELMAIAFQGGKVCWRSQDKNIKNKVIFKPMEGYKNVF